MRAVIILAIGLLALAALAYRLGPAANCAQELSWCQSDPPLFVKLTGANIKAHCQASFQICQARNRVRPEESDGFETATREPVKGSRSNAAPGSGAGSGF
jgi:hypothetical protein